MMLDFKDKKIMIFGIQGSGKTHFAKKVMGQFFNPLVYRVTPDFDNMGPQGGGPPTIYKPTDKYLDLDGFLITAERLGQRKKIDAVVIDELDLFTTEARLERGPLNEWVLMHRHNNCAFIGISRRPQDVPSKIFESAHVIVVFALDAPIVHRKLCDLHPDYELLLPHLSLEKHNFILKEIGKAPVLCNPV
jgi:hypothetical protein